MKNLIAILAFLMMCQAQAQQPAQQVEAAPAEKKTLIYDESANQLVEVAPSVEASATVSNQAQNNSEATATAPAASPIYILNNQRVQGYQGASQASIQEQPTTVISEAPAKASASNAIRKQRAETEAGTEDGIVQALEKARLDDEIRRRDKFNAAIAPQTTSETAETPVVQQVVVPPAQVVIAPPAPTPPAQAPIVQQVITVPDVTVVEEIPAQKPQKRKRVVVEEAEESVDVKSEIRAALAERDLHKEKKTDYYISGLVGMGVYPDADYIQSALATGFTIGVVLPSNLVVEGAFSYGSYTLGYTDSYYYDPFTIDMKQYDFLGAVKYQIFSGKIRPTVGVAAAYVNRTYTSDWFYSSGYGNSDVTSNSLNAGLTAGLDVAVSNNFSIGVDFRYLWSIASKDSYSNNWTGSNTNSWRAQSIDEMAYYTTSVAAKFTF